jgi:hypothetical protein
MKKFLSLFLVCIFMSFLLAGCGAAPASTQAAHAVAAAPAAQPAPAAEAPPNELKNGSVVGAADKAKAANEGNSANLDVTQVDATAKTYAAGNAITGNGVDVQSVSNAILSQRKVIRNANVSGEVDDFDKAYGQIKSEIAAFGYVQETNIKKEKVYVDSKEKLITKGTIIIRVDKDKFDSTLTNVKGLGISFDEEIKGDDVTDKFFDTESQLRLLRFEESRLEQYLNKINDPDVIFKTESRLTDIRHEIEGLTGTLQKWNDLVALSTITINLSEKNPVSSNIPVLKGFSERFTGGFLDSLKGVIHFCGELLILLAQSIPVLILLAIILFGLLAIYRKYFKKEGTKVISKKKDDNFSE